jgi:hypothetical protein
VSSLVEHIVKRFIGHGKRSFKAVFQAFQATHFGVLMETCQSRRMFESEVFQKLVFDDFNDSYEPRYGLGDYQLLWLVIPWSHGRRVICGLFVIGCVAFYTNVSGISVQ